VTTENGKRNVPHQVAACSAEEKFNKKREGGGTLFLSHRRDKKVGTYESARKKTKEGEIKRIGKGPL